MYFVTIYENGETYNFFNEEGISAINLKIDSEEQLKEIINIVLNSGHSIEIYKNNEETKEQEGNYVR